MGTLLALLLAFFTTAARAQDLTTTAPPQSAGVVLVGATVHTATGKTIENGLVAFNEGTIALVGRADDILPRASFVQGTQFIDCEGLHIFPGLIAAETRLGLTEIGAVRAMRDYDEVGPVTPEVRAYVAVNPDSTLIPVARSNGVLTFGCFPSGGLVPGRASVLRADGWTNEDLAITRDAGLIINWPRMTDPYRAYPNRDHDKRSARERLEDLNTLFDDATAYRDTNPDQRTEDLRLAAVATTLPPQSDTDTQSPVFIRTNDLDDITAAVTWCAQRNLKPIIVGGRDAALASDLLNKYDVPVILAGTHTWPKREDAPYDDPFTLPARLADAGVRFCISTSDRDGNVRNLPYEAGRAAAFGLTPEQALAAITKDAADILGLTDLGTIETGKRATLIVTTGHCLEVTANVVLAFVEGRQIDLSNKQTTLRDIYLEKYRQLDLIPTDN